MSNDKKFLFDCDVCGGEVYLEVGEGRTRSPLRDPTAKVALPSDFPVATCASCGEMFLSEQEERDLFLRHTMSHLPGNYLPFPV